MEKKRGFAAFSADRLTEVSSLGGKRAHEVGTAHEWSPDEARRASRGVKRRNRMTPEQARARGRLGNLARWAKARKRAGQTG